MAESERVRKQQHQQLLLLSTGSRPDNPSVHSPSLGKENEDGFTSHSPNDNSTNSSSSMSTSSTSSASTVETLRVSDNNNNNNNDNDHDNE